VLIGKENDLEWSRNNNHNFIFNGVWDGICDGETTHTKPTTDKEISIWMNKDNKSYSLIASSVNEEVSGPIKSIKNYWGSLKKLKYLYD